MTELKKKSLRENFNLLKNDYNKISKNQKVSPELIAIINSLLMLLELIIAIFMEKKIKKTSSNSHKPSSQTEKDQTSTQPGSKGKGKGLNNLMSDNSKTNSAPAFDIKEDCSTENGQIEAAKNAVIVSCKWFEELGSGSKEDIGNAIGKINSSRFCKDNYVWVASYLEDPSAVENKDVKVVTIHPVKPGLEKTVTIHSDLGNGYRVVGQQIYVGHVHPEGCWIPYLWTKPGTEHKVEKISYTMRCKDKTTGKFVMPAAGIYTSHDHLKKLNHPACKGVEKKDPYPL
ncbi:MAG: hypothetical protein HQK51_14460 [Oligoflexia bacterium]|nr:hypothetical protein [Oligoflexia bacterium]